MNPLSSLDSILEIGKTIIQAIIPDKAKQAEANLALLKAYQEGDLKSAQIQMSAIIAEASSPDKWTSRARPSFMYVMYLMILSCVPMGFIMAFDPTLATSISAGVTSWLNSIPKPMWNLFEAGYLGYGVMRSWDKSNTFKK